MTTLYSYCIPTDDGAAPNPFWGICTLVICKPKIRKAACVGDWIVGTGSRRSPVGDKSGFVVYAMKVSQKLTMEEYDSHARSQLPEKIPDWHHSDPRRRLGDAIYDFGTSPPRVRLSVHDERNRQRDLSGQYALLSDHFYYFGNRPRPLPRELRALAQQVRGHRSRANDALVLHFLSWLRSLRLKRNHLYGSPQLQLFDDWIECETTCSESYRPKRRGC